MEFVIFLLVLLVGWFFLNAYKAKRTIEQQVLNEFLYIVRILVAWSRNKSDIPVELAAIDCMNQYAMWEKRVMFYQSGADEYTPEEVTRIHEWKKIIDENNRLFLDWKSAEGPAQRARFIMDCFVELRLRQSNLEAASQKIDELLRK